jgi:biopolymer transport protein ExbD
MKSLNIILILILLFLFSIIYINSTNSPENIQSNQNTSQDQNQTQKKSVRLQIDYGNGEINTYEYNFTDNKSAFDILKDTAVKENIPLETQQYDFGVFIKSIGEKESTTDKAWIYFINGKSGQVAADKYELKSTDSVEWKYIMPEI